MEPSAVNRKIVGSIPSCDAMTACRHCAREFANPHSCGAHTIRCAANPKAATLGSRIAAANRARTVTSETRSRLSRTISAKVEAGTWHNSFAKCRQHDYAGEKFDGSWELKLAQWFDQNEVPWVRNKRMFPYEHEGKTRSYTPDFYMPAADCFVEVKGWKTPKDEAKWNAFTGRLIVLAGSDLQALGLDITVVNDWKTRKRTYVSGLHDDACSTRL